MNSEDEEEHKANAAASKLTEQLHSLRACYNMMKQHGNTLQHTITSYQPQIKDDEEKFNDYLINLGDSAILFGISSCAMLRMCSEFLESAKMDSKRILRMLQVERQRKEELQRMFYEVARQYASLERKSNVVFSRGLSVASKTSLKLSDEEDIAENTLNERENQSIMSEQADVTETDSLDVIRRSIRLQSRNTKDTHSSTTNTVQQEIVPSSIATPRKSTKQRRSRVPDRPNVTINAWSILKNCIGKDLSNIPIPVNFNEPLSFLQRLTEDMEYAELLDKAADMEDNYEQIAYVAAFIISGYASTANRTAKPFNPLLGETYECDRTDDRGWRSIAEQVSHHPPISAMYCEGRDWTCWLEGSLKTKLKGKNLQLVPIGSSYCKFKKSGNMYTWNKVATTVNNLIMGKMWLDHQGEVEIRGLNNAADVHCTLSFIPQSMFSKEAQHRVKGFVRNASGKAKIAVQGFWNSHVEIAPIDDKAENGEPDNNSFKTIWTSTPPDPESEKYHYFSRFACELNELEEGVAPTDSRLRPDLRLMELGRWDESNEEKLRLEQKQRTKHPSDSNKTEDVEKLLTDSYTPLWFTRSFNNGQVEHTYKNTYWNAKKTQDWSRCPDIF